MFHHKVTYLVGENRPLTLIWDGPPSWQVAKVVAHQLPYLSVGFVTLQQSVCSFNLTSWQIFGVPNHHPRSQPFFDHVFTFSVADDRIWFRNFQIVEEDGALAEIGPRFVLNPIKVFEASFSGQTLWDNPRYVTPTAKRCEFNRQQDSFLYLMYLKLLVNL